MVFRPNQGISGGMRYDALAVASAALKLLYLEHLARHFNARNLPAVSVEHGVGDPAKPHIAMKIMAIGAQEANAANRDMLEELQAISSAGRNAFALEPQEDNGKLREIRLVQPANAMALVEAIRWHRADLIDRAETELLGGGIPL
jgi:hypothetical protein